MGHPRHPWFIFLLCCALHAPAWAESTAAKPPVPLKIASASTALKTVDVDPYTGTANFALPLVIPPPRQTMPFSVKLIYSSRAGNGWLGVGWKLNLAYIERSTKNGPPRYDNTDRFVVSLGEGLEELVPIGGGEYRLKTAEGAWQFFFDGQQWHAHDPRGVSYDFGSRQSDFSRTKDPSDSRRVFRWRLNLMFDPNWNSVIFQYLADRIEISYSEKADEFQTSPWAGHYSYHVSIRFTRRPDGLTNVQPGFPDTYPLKGRGRISEVHVRYKNRLVRRYRMTYAVSPATSRSILERVTEYGSDKRTTNPPVTLRYAASQSPAVPDVLQTIDNGIGGSLTFQYRPSIAYSPSLPFDVPVVSSVSIHDGSAAHTTTYTYDGGFFDAGDQEFRGFAKTLAVDEEGRQVETTFLQDDIYKGHIAWQRINDQDGNVVVEVKHTWTSSSPAPGTSIVSLKETLRTDDGGKATFKQQRTTFQHDAYGNPTKITEWGDVALTGDERETILEYAYNAGRTADEDWLVSYPVHLVVRDAAGTTVQETWRYYDAAKTYWTPPRNGLVTKEERWLWNPVTRQASRVVWEYAYDDFGNVTKVTDPLGRSTTTKYASGHHLYPMTAINAAGHTTRYAYDPALRQVTAVVDPSGGVTDNVYDSLGRLIQVYGPDDPLRLPPGTIYEYHTAVVPNKTVIKTKTSYDPKQPAYLTAYRFMDGLGRVIQEQAPAEPDPTTGEPRHRAFGVVRYDAEGRVTVRYLPYERSEAAGTYATDFISHPKVVSTYDALGRLVRTTNPDGTFSERRYDDWTTTSIDENGHTVVETRDAYGNVVKVEEYNGSQVYATTYRYDALNRLIEIKDHQGNLTSMVYDSLGRRLQLKDADRGTTSYEYDALGNLLKQTDGRGTSVEFTYDAINRLLTKRSSGVTLATYRYDDQSKPYAIGRLGALTDRSGSQDFSYDRLGRPTKTIHTIDGVPFTVERAYDAADRLTTLTYPNGERVTYAYNPSGQVASVKTAASTIVERVEYAPSSQITRLEFSNRLRTAYTYDPTTLRLKHILSEGPQGAVQDVAYGFDNVGNIRSIQDALVSQSHLFLYDDLNRLLQAQGPYGTLTYAYDPLGNLTAKEGVGYTYNPARPHTVRFTSDGTLFDYDASGNLTRRTQGAATATFEYDTEQRLLRATVQTPSLSTTDFVYNAQGQRVKKTVNGFSRSYVEGLFERESDGTTRMHVLLGPHRIFTNVSRPTGSASSLFYHPDHLGSSMVVTDSTGAVVQRASYTPFGSFASASPHPRDTDTATHHFFTGQELDPSTELYHLGARYYDPALGRFTQPDPIIQDVYDPQALNPYSYARNNPLRFIDSTGLSFHEGFGTAWSAVTSWTSSTWNAVTSFTARSLNASTTQAMQTFNQPGSSFGSVSGWSRTVFESRTYREVTLPGQGTTTTLLNYTYRETLWRPPTAVDPVLDVTRQMGQQVSRVAQAAGNVLWADPSRLLGWTGRVLTEIGFEHAGRTLGLYGALLEASTGKAYGGIVGGGVGATFGRAFGPAGGIIGGIAGGYVGGVVGGWFDPPVGWPDPWS